MPLFLDIYFIYRIRYNIEVDEEMIYPYNISVEVFQLDVGLHCSLDALELYWWYCIRV